VARNCYIAPKRKTPKKSPSQVYWERQDQFLDLIHKWKEIRDYDLKRVLFSLGWGPGTFERMRRDVINGVTEVNYVKKEKKWVSLKPIEEIKEKQIEESCITNPLLTVEQNKIPLSS